MKTIRLYSRACRSQPGSWGRGISRALGALLFSLFIRQVPAQTLSGQVIALPDNTPVPYATLTTQNHQWGFLANEDGTFELTQLKEGDTLLVSCLGYHEARVPYHELRDNIKVLLTVRPLQLAEAKVKSGGYKDVWLGSKLNSTNSFAGSPTSHDMLEIALWIPNFIQNEGYINKVSYWIGRFGKFKTPFRVRIYAYDHGMPGEDLLNQNLVVKAKRGASWVNVDVSQYNIPLPTNGFFVSLEWLVVPDKRYWYDVILRDGQRTKYFGQNVGTTREFAAGYGIIRNKKGKWQTYSYQNRNNPRPMFRAQVRVYE